MSSPAAIDSCHYVDPDDLICPGCHETVSCQPPVNFTGQRVSRFSHRDGSPLCWHQGGWAEPIEREVFRTVW